LRSRTGVSKPALFDLGTEPGPIALARNGLRVLWAVLMACALLVAVAGLVACSGLGELPTLAPTLALPTPPPIATATAGTAATSSSVSSTDPPFSLQPALVISYDFDPLKGQMALCFH